jgi:hypothetical protein
MSLDDSFDPAAPNSALLPSQQQTYNEAKRLLENGKPAQAAPLFAKLAEVLTSAGQPRRAANLHSQAALAFARSRNEIPALTQARAALTFFLQHQVIQQATVFYTELNRELIKRGMQKAADTLAAEFASKLGPLPTPVTSRAGQIARMPANCPNCGAPIRSSEVHWTEANTAECAYCGTPLHPLA